jgi:hypothetical protein
MSASDENNKEQAEKFAFTTDAVTYILSAAGCPNKFRDYIDCLIGIADGNVEFDASDKQIERRRKVKKSSGRKGFKEYWARDKRRDLLKWQKENDLKFTLQTLLSRLCSAGNCRSEEKQASLG